MALYGLFFWTVFFFVFISYLYIKFLKEEISANHFAFTYATSFTIFITGVIAFLKW